MPDLARPTPTDLTTQGAPPTDEEIGVSRRQFLNRAAGTTVGFAGLAWGASLVGFLWPAASQSSKRLVVAGPVDEVFAYLRERHQPLYVPEAGAWVSEFPQFALANARAAKYPKPVLPLLEQGLVVHKSKCPHLGCGVRFCESSQWFECPCHGSKYNAVGEKTAGPAPRGMTLVHAKIDKGLLEIDADTIFVGMPIGTDTTDQDPEGPFCY